MTLREVLLEGTARLRDGNIDTPSLDASLLLAWLLKIEKARLVLMYQDDVSSEIILSYKKLIERRLAGECVAYITGVREFWGLEFQVGPDVLVPRPDTEILVEAALGWIRNRPAEQRLRVLDVCTGSGAVAVAVKHSCPELDIAASDISPAALKFAERNISVLLGDDKIKLYQSDLLNNVPGSFDLIISNPPYVPAGLIPLLSKEVQCEPYLALDGGTDGLDLIRVLVPQAMEKLNSGGGFFLEADSGQMAFIKVILEKAGFSAIEIYKDLAGLDRVIGGIKHQEN